MAGTLSIVSTPIGHLDDITLRALNVLKAADLIAAEDTRRTGKLLAHFAIATPTVSFHEHNSRARVPALIAKLKAGQSIALVSDAGTPTLSDPGLALVQESIREGIAVDPLPGASAPLALAVVSGFPIDPLTIFGFAPSRSSDRKRWLVGVLATPHCVTFFESPHRIERTLEDLASLSGDRPIVVGRELTKVHQAVYRGTTSSVRSTGIEPRGEFTIMLGPALQIKTSSPDSPSDQQLSSEFGEMTETALVERRVALKELAVKYGLSTKQVYSAVLRGKSAEVFPLPTHDE